MSDYTLLHVHFSFHTATDQLPDMKDTADPCILRIQHMLCIQLRLENSFYSYSKRINKIDFDLLQ